VVAGGDATLVFWDGANHQQLGPPITSQKDRIWALAFSPDGKLLASAGNGREDFHHRGTETQRNAGVKQMRVLRSHPFPKYGKEWGTPIHLRLRQ